MGIGRIYGLAVQAIFLLPAAALGQVSIEQAAGRLGITLEAGMLQTPAVRRGFEELARERCDKTAIEGLGRALERAGYRREAANAFVGFSTACGGHPLSLSLAANILLNLSDYSGSAAAATRLIELEPHGDNGYFLRGLANYEGRNYHKAVDDFVTAIELFSPKDRISSVGYVYLSRSYEKLGQFCDATLPLEAWVALNPARNATGQIRSMLSSLSSKAKCPAPIAAEEVIPLTRIGNVVTLPVAINGVRGIFILDTGATFVSLQRSFAEAAKVEIEEGSVVSLNTANGLTMGKRGRAKLISLKAVKASDVPVVVQADQKASYGKGIDGLLGMSFLSHFDIQMDGRAVRLKPRTGR